jgi:hypothetical protein
LVWAAHAGVLMAAWRGGKGFLPVLACWLVVLYFAVRVGLDARLFDLLAHDPAQAPGRLDEWLVQSGLRRAKADRGMEDRCHGARCLARNLAGAWLVEMVTLVFFVLRGPA